MSDAPTTWLSMASSLPLDELVVAGDHLILDPVVLDPHDLRPHTSIEALAQAVASSHVRGTRDADAALRMLRQGSESRPETLVRLLLVRAGLPEPEINVEIRDANGRLLGRGDLVYRLWRTLIEYDGDHHRTNAFQYNKDITRIERFNEEGWSTVRVRKAALFGAPDDVVARVTRALRRGGWPG
ncbi:hypothetical protein [Glaciihabitans sp. dw_435]|uniref:hypothetical protein n=1 Tax=Glaciihabitans sp. dw_435 TaxID=2720081 RepID=UPI001BD3854D|nr:hypothetical protein [Glaciihabitans sp. dw_435]